MPDAQKIIIKIVVKNIIKIIIATNSKIVLHASTALNI